MFTQNQNRIRMTLLVVVLIISLGFSGLPAAQAQTDGPAELFGDAGNASPTADVPDPSYVARSRYVNVNVGMLFDGNGKPLDKQSLPEISLNLFPDASYIGVLTRVQKDASGTYWIGSIKDIEGYFYLLIVDGVFIAHVASPEGVYEVSWAGDNLYKAVQIDQSKFVDEDPAATFGPPGDVLAEGDLGPTADSDATIDIMVAFTDDARAAEGGTAAMKARIALAVTETNTSYANAGITTRLRLVHVQEYPYVETGNLGTELDRVRNTTDAYFTTVHSLRDTYGADMVSLIVENGGGYCGMGYVMATAAYAFQVTVRSCATGNYSFGHEFGHLQGALHDVYVDPSTTPFAYGHGYVHLGTTTAQRWRTVMAYNNQCAANGYNCTRLQWWSNPTKTWLSAAMGVTNSSENYKVLNTTDYTIANFRTAVIGSVFNSNFNTSSIGWSAVNGTWALVSGAYYKSTGLANTCVSAKHTGKYGDLTYEVQMKRTQSSTYTGMANRIIIRGNPASLGSWNSWKPSYVFQYSNDGDFSVWEIASGGSEVALKGWTLSSAVVKNGWNTLKVVAVGASLKFYINGTLVWSGADSTLKTGAVGFGYCRQADTGSLIVNYAKLTNTATADAKPNEEVAPGEEIPGGSIDQSP